MAGELSGTAYYWRPIVEALDSCCDLRYNMQKMVQLVPMGEFSADPRHALLGCPAACQAGQDAQQGSCHVLFSSILTCQSSIDCFVKVKVYSSLGLS